MSKTKVCMKCEKRKSTSLFRPSPKTEGGFSARCKACLEEAALARESRPPKNELFISTESLSFMRSRMAEMKVSSITITRDALRVVREVEEEFRL